MSLRRRIDTMCKRCIYDPNAAGSWRQQVTICTSFDCPLYSVRPRSGTPIRVSLLDSYGLKMVDFPTDCGFTLADGHGSRENADSMPEKGQIAPALEGLGESQ